MGDAPDDFATQVHVFIRNGIKEKKVYFLTDPFEDIYAKRIQNLLKKYK
jgi:hypothetical protein